MAKLRALVFDLWGTLLLDDVSRSEPRRVARQRLVHEALAGAGRVYPEGRIAAALGALSDFYQRLHAEGRDASMEECVTGMLDTVEPGLTERLSPKALAAIEEAIVLPLREQPPVPAPGAVEVLQEARRRKLAVGLISNTGITPGYALREVLAEHGLLSYLQVLTFSDEARLAKPSPAIFHCTLEALRVKPAEAAFIGDSPRLDVTGPRAVGMWAVQIGTQPNDGARPHARIDGLPELFPALLKLGLVRR